MRLSRQSERERIGLVAGWGRFPVVLAQALQQQSFRVYCLGIKGHADPVLGKICHDFRWTGVAKVGAQVRYFRRHGIGRAVMAGKLFKHLLLFHGIGWIRHLPDWRCFCIAYPHFLTKSKDRKDDSILTTYAEAFAADGIHFLPATDFAPELLVNQGILTCRRPSPSEAKDVNFGWQLAKEMGRLDIGQTVVVKGQAVLAVEAIEGTDQCIRRAGKLCPQGGFTVVKVAKPQQDMRFDVPTIGMGTLESIVQAGARVLAIEADKTIIIDQEDVIQFANRHRLTVVACCPGLAQSEVAAA